jgi:TP901 family phage tail tape measure protein
MKDLGFGVAIKLGIAGLTDLTKTNKGLKDLSAIARNSDKGIKEFSRSLAQYRLNLREINKLQQENKNIKSKIGDTLKTGAIAAAALAIPVKLSIDFEGAMTDLGKAANFVDKQEKELFGEKIQSLTRVLPQSAVELANMMKIASEGNTAKKDLVAFTQAAGDMSLAFGVDGAAMTASLAQIATAFAIDVKGAKELGASVAALAVATDTGAGGIMQAVEAVGTAAKSFGITETQTAALATTFMSLGKTPTEAAGSIEKLMLVMSNADNGGKAFQETLQKMGMDANTLKYAIKNNAGGAIEDFLAGLEGIDKEDRIAALSDIVGKREAEGLNVLVDGLGKYKDALAAANSKEAGNAAMQKKLSIARDDTGYQLKMLRNSLSQLGSTVGSIVLPALNKFLSVLIPIIRSISDFINNHKTLAKVVFAVVGALYAARLISLAYAFALNFSKIKILSLSNALIAHKITTASTAVTTAAASKATVGFGLSALKGAGIFRIAARGISMAIRAIPIIGWIALAVEAIMWLSGKFGGFGNLCAWVWDKIKLVLKWSPFGLIFQAWSAVFDWLGSKFEWVQNIIDAMSGWVSAAVDKIKGVFGSVAKFFGFGDDDNVEVNNEKTAETYNVDESSYDYAGSGGYEAAAVAQSVGGGNVNINFSGNFLIGTSGGQFNLDEFKIQVVKAVKEALGKEARDINNRRIVG